MKFDLHMHSSASSDGELTPQQLADMAASHHIDVIALCDHDTTRNVDAVSQAAKDRGIQVIPGIEVSTCLGDQSVHLLGYGIDVDDPWLGSLEENARKSMEKSFHARVEKLCRKYGFEVDEADILARAGESNPWFTLMDDLLALPQTRSIEDFQDYLPGGSRSDPAAVNFYWDKCMPGSDLFVKAEAPDLIESIDRIHQAGGLAVIAHPFKTFDHQDELLEKLIDAGLDGLEVYSNYHTPEQIAYYKQFALDHNLLMTCGSDFHGAKKPSIVMGEYHMEEDGTPYLEALLAALAKE